MGDRAANARRGVFRYRVAFGSVLLFAALACAPADEEFASEEPAATEPAPSIDPELPQLEPLDVPDEITRGGETYDEFDRRRDSYGGSRGSFGDYECTEDCSGHEAGYDWASERGISDPDDCGGNSWSFEEGCRQYAEENGY